MVIIKQNLWGVVPFTRAFFPMESSIDGLLARLKPNELARLFWTAADREPGGQIVARESSTAVCVDLRKSEEALWSACHRGSRYHIKRAQQVMDHVTISRNGAQATAAFLEIFNEFARVKDHVSPINARILNYYAPHSDIFVIFLDGKPMCGHAVLRDSESRVRACSTPAAAGLRTAKLHSNAPR